MIQEYHQLQLHCDLRSRMPGRSTEPAAAEVVKRHDVYPVPPNVSRNDFLRCCVTDTDDAKWRYGSRPIAERDQDRPAHVNSYRPSWAI